MARNGDREINLLDKVIGYVAPRSAARRLQARNYIQMYEGANFSRARSLLPVSAFDARYEAPPYTRLTLLSHARYLHANLGFMRGAVDDLRRYSLGPYGLRPESNSKNEEWAKEAEDFFTEWCKIADVSARFTFGDLQRMAVLVAAIDGDCGMILVKTASGFPKLQFIEGHQIKKPDPVGKKPPESVDGVIVNDVNEPLGYQITTTKANGDKASETVEAANFIHFFDPERYSGTRGISWLAHALNNGRDIFDLIAYEKQFLHNACSQTLVEYNDKGGIDQTASFIHQPDGTATGGDTVNSGLGQDVKLQYMQGGEIRYMRANSGQKVEPFQFNRPTAAFTEFMDYLEGDGYIGLGLPHSWKHLHKEGGATLRAALIKAQRRFDEISALVEIRICNRVWNWVTAVAAKQKRISARPPDAYKVRWHGPAKATVDAGREAAANIKDSKFALRSYAEDYGERGLDWRAALAQIAKENAYITELAEEVGEPRENIQQRIENAQPKIAGAADEK